MSRKPRPLHQEHLVNRLPRELDFDYEADGAKMYVTGYQFTPDGRTVYLTGFELVGIMNYHRTPLNLSHRALVKAGVPREVIKTIMRTLQLARSAKPLPMSA
jgi:hypothetical protein